MKASTVMPSITLPCHVSLFCSVDPSRHGILGNTYTEQVRPVRGLCEQLSGVGKSCVFFYNWEELRDLTRPGSLIHAHYDSGISLGFETASEQCAAIRETTDLSKSVVSLIADIAEILRRCFL